MRHQLCKCSKDTFRRSFICTVALFLLGVVLFPIKVIADDNKTHQAVTLKLNDISVEQAIKSLESQVGCSLFINRDNVKMNSKLTLDIENATLQDAIKAIFGKGFTYQVVGDMIAVVEDKNPNTRSNKPETPVAQRKEISGTVKDNGGDYLPGVTIMLKGTTMGTTTDIDGKFNLFLPSVKDIVIVVTFVGMETQEIPYKGQQTLNIVMKPDAQEMEEVVVTGIFTRKKESFTGSASTYSVEELKSVGTQNILQSLKTLDPAFAVLENTLHGSDPNQLPNMEIRGKSSMLGVRDELEADPNQPLFILDGFESTLAVINDLDINRVESITILKDAASTAIYGSKAANGVVVVETVRPKSGKLMVNYSGNLNVSVPDLTSYNMMNASEKLEFEKLAGRYYPTPWKPTNEILLNQIYNDKLKSIESGVDTYWLSEPLRTGVNQKHSLYIQGGEGSFLFGLGAGYNGITGVMKTSLREVISGNIDLIYRKEKLLISNKSYFTNTKVGNPIVTFSDYVNANPYFQKLNEDGEVDKWLENNDFFKSPNPLWNDKQNSRNKGKEIKISNFLNVEYRPTDAIRIRGKLGLSHSNNEGEVFLSREDTQFENVALLRKGRYTSRTQKDDMFEGDITATYAKVLGRHTINAVLGGNMQSSKRIIQGYVTEGFPEGDFTYPSFSNGYPEGGRPLFQEIEKKSMNGYMNLGYAYANRYLMDFSLRRNGSSVFGSSKRYIGTWSVGLGWNLHNETLISDNLSWINFFKLRASIGNPANQNFDSGYTITTYNIGLSSLNYFGLGATIDRLGNADLDWQVTLDKNIGMDLTLFNRRFNVTADYYYKTTDPLLIAINMPESSGADVYRTNLGKQKSQGLTLSTSYFLVQNTSKRINWQIRANLRTQKTKLSDLGNKLNDFNQFGKGRNLVRYYDGADPDDIWVVRSGGIDPSTGRELFYDKDGNFTYDFSYDNEIIYGNTRPDYEGVFGSSVTIKGFSLSVNFRYQTGAYLKNTALFNKVENISLSSLNYNQDKRALYERWKEPGDIAKFKDIANAASSPMSSRFVQKENVISMESVNMAYEFIDGWVKHVGFSSFKIQASMRDVFRVSTVKAERGIYYPFARNFELGLAFNF
ncbi:MAG: SusC/RagA family TonB-linked outer membrane protein [Marinifilaceae bacterium]